MDAGRILVQVLVVRCQTGDREAFADLVGLYGTKLRYYLAKLLGDPAAAEDAAQEVWFDVFKGLPRLAAPAAFPAWLYRIARARAYQTLRQRPEPCVALGEVEPADPASDAGDFSPEDAERVHRALDQLSPEHREALVLRFLEGLSYEDIAAVVGCELGTVRSRIHYAKRALRLGMERTNKT